MKKTIAIITAALFFFNINLKAQDDPNCGFVVDGILVDSITSWSIGELSVVFPIKQNWKKYDFIEGIIYFDGKINSRKQFFRSGKVARYAFRMKPEDIQECANSNYATCTIVKKEDAEHKQNLAQNYYCTNCKEGAEYFTQPLDENDKPIKPMMWMVLRGHTITGYTNDALKLPIYDGMNGSLDDTRHDHKTQILASIHYGGEVLFTSKQIPFKLCFCTYDKSAYKKVVADYQVCDQCKIESSKQIPQPGKKFNFQMENIGVSGQFPIGKAVGSNTGSNEKTEVKTNTTETKTTVTKTTTTKTTGNTQTKLADGLVPYVEKWDNGKIRVQGQKNKDEELQGTWKYYDESGKLWKTEEYKDNELISTKEN